MRQTTRYVFRVDPFLILLIATIGGASIFPVRDSFAEWTGISADFAVAMLFFLHGARLSRAAMAKGTSKWQLHLLVFVSTYAIFPVIGLLLAHFTRGWFDALLLTGLIYLTLLPSAVQSSVAFTAIARGNVAAAKCSASLSNLLGILVTPFLVGLLIHGGHGAAVSSVDSSGAIIVQCLLPFLAGHLLRPWIGAWLEHRRRLLQIVDRGSILLVIYTAFSAAVVREIWQRVGLVELAGLLGLSVAILALVLVANVLTAKLARLPREDAIVLLFCGSKKSFMVGVPMAAALFDPAQVGVIALPLMIFHQAQLFASAILASRFRQQSDHTKATNIGPDGMIADIPRANTQILETARHLGMVIPLACLPDIAANLALLDRHAAILRAEEGGAS